MLKGSDEFMKKNKSFVVDNAFIKEVLKENLSLKEQLKNMIDIYYNTEKAKMENEIKSRDKDTGLMILQVPVDSIPSEAANSYKVATIGSSSKVMPK